MTNSIEIKNLRGWYAIFAGASKLSKGFRKESDCIKELESNRKFYDCWAGSASVKFDNRIATGQYTEIRA